ncbi:gamma-glutamylcyclotransferase-like [Symsagittifera roscoffensis]|uniref:gamma-glutamylcyclotransferase-like n=1 Tax=Symsagittifera roscoffensis TaxID=84072 RepID=UPI00307B4D47
MGDTLKYFAYGSNLLAERLCIGSCPSVKVSDSFVKCGKINGWYLEFANPGHESLWMGGSATIKKGSSEAVVWGAIWKIDANDLKNLDFQECVHEGLYYRVKSPEDILIVDSENQPIDCYTYIMNDKAMLSKPSPQYKHVILCGAKQIDLPIEYRENVLEAIETNDNAQVKVNLSVLPNGKVPVFRSV